MHAHDGYPSSQACLQTTCWKSAEKRPDLRSSCDAVCIQIPPPGAVTLVVRSVTLPWAHFRAKRAGIVPTMRPLLGGLGCPWGNLTPDIGGACWVWGDGGVCVCTRVGGLARLVALACRRGVVIAIGICSCVAFAGRMAVALLCGGLVCVLFGRPLFNCAVPAARIPLTQQHLSHNSTKEVRS